MEFSAKSRWKFICRGVSQAQAVRVSRANNRLLKSDVSYKCTSVWHAYDLRQSTETIDDSIHRRKYSWFIRVTRVVCIWHLVTIIRLWTQPSIVAFRLDLLFFMKVTLVEAFVLFLSMSFKVWVVNVDLNEMGRFRSEKLSMADSVIYRCHYSIMLTERQQKQKKIVVSHQFPLSLLSEELLFFYLFFF